MTDEDTACTVCLELFVENVASECRRATMPCGCDRAGSTMAFCVRCVEIICEQAPAQVGRCPKCRAFIRCTGEQGASRFALADRTAQCRACHQIRTILDGELCDACLLGMRYCFRYECARCQRTQRIPHPMWRYQRTAIEYSTDTWACHRGCAGFTHWRILADDAARIPRQETPASWGSREEWLTEVRLRRRMEIEAQRRGRGLGGGIDVLISTCRLLVCIVVMVIGLVGTIWCVVKLGTLGNQ